MMVFLRFKMMQDHKFSKMMKYVVVELYLKFMSGMNNRNKFTGCFTCSISSWIIDLLKIMQKKIL